MSIFNTAHYVTTLQRQISNTWVKVCCFLDMMGSQELYSSLLLTSSSSLSGPFPFHPLSIGAERWQVGDMVTKQILSVIQPTSDSEKRRREIIEYLQTLFENFFGIKVFPFGSVPLKTYLPHGDVDLTAVSRYHTSQDLAADIHNLLKSEMMNNINAKVKDVLYVPAQVKVVKCTVNDIAVDISFNQTAGLSALCFLKQVDQYIGKDHLFKRSVILIKAWCFYESRLLGGYYGLMSTYALETLVLHVINHFHCSLQCPLAVLYKFLEYYCMFDWERYCVAITGLVSLSSLPEIEVHPPLNSDEILVAEDFVRGFRETFLSSFVEICRTNQPAFPVKFLNIMDPLRDDNNLGRSVSKGNFFRIRSAFNYASGKITKILMLPPEKIAKELEFFFVNTLYINGKGRRADVLVPVPEYGAGCSKTPSASEDNEDLLTGIDYDLWFDDYGIVSPIQLNTPAIPRGWGNEWMELSHKMQFDPSMYYGIHESPLFSNNTPISLQLTNSACEEDKGMSRGTGAYIPYLGQAGFRSGFGRNFRTAVQMQNRRDAAIQILVKAWCTQPGNPFQCCHFLAKWPHGETLEDYVFEDNVGLEGSEKEVEEEVKAEEEEALEEEEEVKTKEEETMEEEEEVDEAMEEESLMNSKTNESQLQGIISPNIEDESSDVGADKCVVKYTLEDFPLLPGNQPIPTHIEGVDDTFSVQVVENENNFNCSSPTSATPSESGKPLKIDVSPVKDKKELSKIIEENPVVPVKPLKLKDDREFPPLRSVRPAEPRIRFNKKEFPPLGKNVKLEKNIIWNKNLKELLFKSGGQSLS